MPDESLDPETLDLRLNWPLGRVARLARRGELPHVVLPDGSIRFRWSAIAQLIRNVPASPREKKGADDETPPRQPPPRATGRYRTDEHRYGFLTPRFLRSWALVRRQSVRRGTLAGCLGGWDGGVVCHVALGGLQAGGVPDVILIHPEN